MISIIVPSYKDFRFLRQCLNSIVENTHSKFELIIINDSPDIYEELDVPGLKVNTREFLDSLTLADPDCRLRVIHNKQQRWVNFNWEVGSFLAMGEYVAILNSDITLSKDWDKYLIEALSSCTIACPFETNPYRKEPFGLDPYQKKHCPNMIKGSCFMFKAEDVEKLFPIPGGIRHWCGDNVLADRAQRLDGVKFVKKAQIFHYVTQAGRKVPKGEYLERITKDIAAYQEYSGRDMGYILSQINNSLE